MPRPVQSEYTSFFSNYISLTKGNDYNELIKNHDEILCDFWTKISKEKSVAWLGQRQYYGDLDSNKVFSNAFSKWLQEIWDSGVESAIDTYLQ